MKTTFFDYYSPTPEQYEILWREALIVPDTNILLDLYRLPANAREEFLKVLELLQERLWIPYQVAIEYQKRRLDVISREKGSIETLLDKTKSSASQIKQNIENLEIDKRGLKIEAKPLIDELEKINVRLVEVIESIQDSQLDIAASDPVRDRLDTIFSGRVGPGPATQEDIDKLVQDGDSRYSYKIPPGFLDNEKDKNPNDAGFIHNHIKYQRKFGDLILWRQLIDHVSTNNIKNVLIVTSDKKDDWWWKEHGKTIGPLPELTREMRQKASVELFWMYQSAQFLEHAKKYKKAQVSPEVVAELKETEAVASELSEITEALFPQDIQANRAKQRHAAPNYASVEQAVHKWINERHPGSSVVSIGQFPDLIAFHEGKSHGYEIVLYTDHRRNSLSSTVMETLQEGRLAMAKGRLTGFTAVLVISADNFIKTLESPKDMSDLQEEVEFIIDLYPISGIAIGTTVKSHFLLLFERHGEPTK